MRFEKGTCFMPTLVIEGRLFEVDEDAFLSDHDVWTEEVAQLFAKTEGLDTLTEDHWKVIRYLREYFEEAKSVPMIRTLCHETGFKLTEIYKLFQAGPVDGACKIAGLPNPYGRV